MTGYGPRKENLITLRLITQDPKYIKTKRHAGFKGLFFFGADPITSRPHSSVMTPEEAKVRNQKKHAWKDHNLQILIQKFCVPAHQAMSVGSFEQTHGDTLKSYLELLFEIGPQGFRVKIVIK